MKSTDTDRLIEMALSEDAVSRDLTGIATIAETQQGAARITAKAAGRLSGVQLARKVFEQVDPAIEQKWLVADGDHVKAGRLLCELKGPMRSLLAAERTALNFLQHLSGIATATASYVEALSGTNCQVVDTRKTTPGMRKPEKAAVVHGGGGNHRMDLQSGMLIKENHIEACGSITEAVGRCYALSDEVWVEVECETFAQLEEAIHACPDIILLDNMTPDEVAKARKITPGSILLEASGNITLDNARAYAETGVDRIAIGAITHSAPALDLSMRVTSETTGAA
ncbi:MAG: carboxylating nicotinate-nucleotide diphosphorylase [Mariprofundaceae bacterium]|nr:carboxylating nicotinate-nucleotide diphosphorylase [Mariprofundaceae bacterium]